MSNVKVVGDKVFRHAGESFENFKKIINILQKNFSHDIRVIETKIFSEEEKILEHKYIFPIIHSGEYTASMAYDVTKTILEMANEYISAGIYLCDALPHNYTYNNGTWVLYDFGGLENKSINSKTLIRNLFKISFSSFELLKKIPRDKLQQFFLNRISQSEFCQMTEFKSYLPYFLKSRLLLSLCALGLPQKAYAIANGYFDKYYENHNKKYYKNNPAVEDLDLVNLLDRFMDKISAQTSFGIGQNAAMFAVNSKFNSQKFVAFNDYDLCDEFYNYIYKINDKNVTTAVLYPFVDDETIGEKLAYRAVYDAFAKERFCSDVAFVLDFSELYSCDEFNIKDFLDNISDFTKRALILGFKENEEDLFNITKNEISKYYGNIEIVKNNKNVLIFATDKIKADFCAYKEYDNANRIQQRRLHSRRILEILKQNK